MFLSNFQTQLEETIITWLADSFNNDSDPISIFWWLYLVAVRALLRADGSMAKSQAGLLSGYEIACQTIMIVYTENRT